MINIHTTDSYIVNRDELIVELVDAMANQRPLTLSMNYEGPCAESLGLYDLLDNLTARFNYDPTNITISTSNLIEKHNKYKIVIVPQLVFLKAAQTFANANKLKSKEFTNEFKTFGNFIGHGNMHRLHTASHLNKNYKDKTLQTYHYNRNNDYHRMFVGIDDMLSNNYSVDEIDCAYEFLKQTPLTQDSIDQYPILTPTNLNISKIYHNFFVEIVNVTYFSGNSFFICEKIWRPIMMKTPFLVQGPPNYILNLRRLGFKTFDAWWDEGYSEDPGRCQVDGILDNVGKLSKYSTTELENMYNKMLPVLEHNYQLLMSLEEKDFLFNEKT